MSERYLPESEFLQACIDEEVPLSGSQFADANLARLIAMTRDDNKSNRDWAIFLLAQTGLDTTEIRAVFKHALGDEDEDVRAEALVGIAQREPTFALPLVADLLTLDRINGMTLEAASYVANSTLLPELKTIRADLANVELDGMTERYLDQALEGCATGIQPQWRDFDD